MRKAKRADCPTWRASGRASQRPTRRAAISTTRASQNFCAPSAWRGKQRTTSTTFRAVWRKLTNRAPVPSPFTALPSRSVPPRRVQRPGRREHAKAKWRNNRQTHVSELRHVLLKTECDNCVTKRQVYETKTQLHCCKSAIQQRRVIATVVRVALSRLLDPLQVGAVDMVRVKRVRFEHPRCDLRTINRKAVAAAAQFIFHASAH